ncbi:hypothetical protein [Streptomyces chartreusis]
MAKARTLFAPPELHHAVVRSHEATAPATPEALAFELRVKMLGAALVASGKVRASHLEAVREQWRTQPGWMEKKKTAETGTPVGSGSDRDQPTPTQIATSGGRLLFALGAQSLALPE